MIFVGRNLENAITFKCVLKKKKIKYKQKYHKIKIR